MLAAAYNTIEDIEILWTLISAIGLGFSLWNLSEAKKDKVAIARANIGNGRSNIARTVLKAEIARVIKQLIFLIIGILAMTLPSTPDQLDQPPKMVIIGIVLRWGLIIASALTSYQAYLAYRLRSDLLNDHH